VATLSLVVQGAAEAGMATREGPKSTIVAPFGFPSNQPPPPGSVVNLADFEVGFTAQQVCGYTDWSTLQLRLPKKLLSKEYWKNVGTGLQNEATRLAMSLTGALPSMLACNVSPTFCHVFNQAEMMAAFEGDLSFKTCQMLDNVSNVSMTQAEGLRNCMASQMKASPSLTASEARERCLTKPNDADLSKGDKVARTAAGTSAADSFSITKFIDDTFPDSVKQSGGSTYSLTSGPYRYSRLSRSKTFMKELFPGVELTGSASFMRGGTFNPTVDNVVVKRSAKTSDKIMEILKAMKPLQDQGKAPSQIIAETQNLWADKTAWSRDGEVPVIYRARPDGGEPALLVTPEQIVMLLAFAKPGESDPAKALSTPELRQVVDRLSTATAQVQVNDMLADIYTRTLDQCTRNPAYQGAVAQENCKGVLERAKGEMEILAYKRDAERQARTVQVEIADIVRDVQAQRVGQMRSVGRDSPEAPTGAVPMPGTL
jgi:hypothetical protein